MESEQTIDPEVIERDRAVALRHPGLPTTVDELSALEKGRGRAIIEQRAEILDVLRIASIKLTMPNDWTLFRAIVDGAERISGFLGDQGCDRIKKLWGIQIDNISSADRIEAKDGTFAYQITGDGKCGVTGECVYDIEGIRYSNERYADDKPEGIQREVAVRKAARANLDGSITRELAGMKSVPVEELTKAWEGSWKKWEMCNRGRGFGSGDERVGGTGSSGVDPADIPLCEVCEERGKRGVKLVFRSKGQKGPFWGCPNYKDHTDKPFTVDDAKLRADIANRKKLAEDPGK